MPTRQWIGLQLRKARQPKKQEEVAEDLRGMGISLSQNRLSRLERGESDMTPEELSAFCRYFGVTPEYFLFERSDQSRATRVKEDKGLYDRVVQKLEELDEEELEAIERIVDQLKKK